MDSLTLFLFGCAGGLIAEFVAVFSHKDRPTSLPPQLKSYVYVGVGIFWIFVGGFFSTIILEGLPEEMSKIIPVQIGMTAPLIAQRLVSATGVGVDNILKSSESLGESPSGG